MSQRFSDTRETLYSFNGETLVCCPACDGCARSLTIDPMNKDWFAPRRLTCLRCGYSRTWAEREITRQWREARDDYFGLPLWLRADCCGATLWAYNIEHLEYIERFVRADLRERVRDERQGWMNASLASRLPRWLKLAKNRQTVLHSIQQLRMRASAA